MDVFEIFLLTIGGLALFLYAVITLGEIIQQAAGEQSKKWIEKFTGNVFTSILTGLVVTTILDSSSAVIIIAIVLVNAQVLTLRQSMGIVLGANVGTTISSQIIATDIGKYSPVFLVAGLVLLMLSKTEFLNRTGKIILFFGMLFFGLFTMENAVEPLKNHRNFTEWMKELENPVKGALVGAIVTLIVQSSSATVGMAITLAKKGLLSLGAGIAIMIGAELGTCSDTLLATIKGSRQAVKTGIFHLLFNLFSIIIGLLVFTPFVWLVEKISAGAGLERQIANGHVMFNVAGVLVMAFFVPKAERLLNKLLPDKINKLKSVP
jgi:phosphate:Na+ symporter